MTKKVKIIIAITVLSLLSITILFLSFFGSNLFFYFTLLKPNEKVLNIIPQEHIINADAANFVNKYQITVGDFDFSLPWNDVDKIRTSTTTPNDNKAVIFKSGITVISSYDDSDFQSFKADMNEQGECFSNLKSEYEFKKEYYNTTLKDFNLWGPRQENACIASGLTLKFLTLLINGIYSFNYSDIKGFQVNGENSIMLEIYNDNLKPLTISIIDKNNKVTQEEVDYIISSIKIKK